MTMIDVEIRALKAVEHPHVLKFYAAHTVNYPRRRGMSREVTCLVLEYAKAGTLMEMVGRWRTRLFLSWFWDSVSFPSRNGLNRWIAPFRTFLIFLKEEVILVHYSLGTHTFPLFARDPGWVWAPASDHRTDVFLPANQCIRAHPFERHLTSRYQAWEYPFHGRFSAETGRFRAGRHQHGPGKLLQDRGRHQSVHGSGDSARKPL